MRIKSKTDIVQLTYHQQPSIVTNYNVNKVNQVQFDEFYQVDLAEVVDFVKPNQKNKDGENIYVQGAIKCRLLYLQQYKDKQDLVIMLPRDPFIHQMPIIGEIVLCSKHPSFEFLDVKQGINLDQYYYFGVLNILNNQNHNAVLASSIIGLQEKLPDQNSKVYGQDFYYNDEIQEVDVVPGDVKFSGRYGNSLKFTHILSKDGKKRLPIIIISNNHDKINILDNGQRFQSLNNCGSSIFLQNIDSQPNEMIQISSQRSLLDEINEFSLRGNSIVANSDKIIINTKVGDFELYSKQNIELSSTKNIFVETKNIKMKANTVTIIVGGNEIIVDSKGVSINASKITLNGTTTINGIQAGSTPGFCSLPNCLFTGAPHTINMVGSKQ